MFTSTTFIFLLVTVWTVSAEIGVLCQPGWTLYGAGCFNVGRGNITYEDADNECYRLGGDLVWDEDTVKSVLENANLSGVTSAWVDYEWWDDGYFNCTIFDSEKDWELSMIPCDTDDIELLYVCEGPRPLLKDCFGSSCYTVTDDTRHNGECERDNRGYLARIESIEENQFVAEFLKDVSSVADSLLPSNDFDFQSPTEIDGSRKLIRVTKGGRGSSRRRNDIAKKEQWVFSNGDQMTFWNWAENEPNNNGDDEDCIAIRPGTNNWNDLDCISEMHYLCEEDNIDMSG